MSEATAIYDAVVLTQPVKGGRFRDRLRAATDLVQPFLAGTGLVHLRSDGPGRTLATRDSADKTTFAPGHERAGEPRYTWTDGPDGLKLGKLVVEVPQP